MKLLFKQRVFSWLDSYDVYREDDSVLYSVKGRLALGHCLDIHDANGTRVGMVKEELLTLLPRFAIYLNDQYAGQIKKEFTFFKPVFALDCNGWTVEGDYFEWDYRVLDAGGRLVMKANKELFHWGDTYSLDIGEAQNALLCLMIVLAIDAAKCSRGNG